MELKEKILEELRKGDRYLYELYDALKLDSYSKLLKAMKELAEEGKVQSYFKPSPTIPSLTYTLVRQFSFMGQ